MKAMKMKGVEGICSEAVASANGELDGIFAGVMPQVIFAGCDAKKWHSILGTPVAAKWAKPVSRLISKAADGFNSIAYRDIESISPLLEAAACTHGGGRAASMASAYHSLEAAHKGMFWKTMDLVAQTSAMANGENVSHW